MSLDIFMQAYRSGEPTTFKRMVMDQVFGANLSINEDDFARVGFTDGSGGQMFFSEGDDLHGVMFNHCGGEAFWNALFDLLKRTGSVLFWPGGGGYLVADMAVVAHLPRGMVAESDTVTLVTSGTEIFKAIFGH